MIDVTIKITIDEEHEEGYDEILDKVAAIEGIETVAVDVDSYFEYNVDSTPHYDEEETPREQHYDSGRWFIWINRN